MKINKAVIGLVGLAWPFLGLGFMAVYFGYLPSGVELVSIGLGLFLAGALSGCLFMIVHANMKRPFGRALIVIGYILFAPLGLMAPLLAPGSIEAATDVSLSTMLVGAPLEILMRGNLAVALGLILMAWLAVFARGIAMRIENKSELNPEPIRAHH